MLFSHVIINTGMTVGLLPITGTPFPLLSYGGTFMLTSMCALGIIQNVLFCGIKQQRKTLLKER
jgi:rod shape determining protein RodA